MEKTVTDQENQLSMIHAMERGMRYPGAYTVIMRRRIEARNRETGAIAFREEEIITRTMRNLFMEEQIQNRGIRIRREPVNVNAPLTLRPNIDLGYERQETIDCAICLETGLMCTLSCNHKYHQKCINKWLEHNDTCPICRSALR